MAADATKTEDSDEKLTVPGDESLDAQDSDEETDDEEDNEDEIDEELLDLAATFGVSPDDFDTAAELEKEIYRVAGQQDRQARLVEPAAESTPEEYSRISARSKRIGSRKP